MNTQTKQISIQTLTPTYDKLEDRIRLSINYQDMDNRIDLMITRSFILNMLPTIEEYIYKYYPESIDEDEITHIEAKVTEEVNANKSLSQTNMEDLELYRSLEELLYTINLTYDKESKHTTLQFISKSKHSCVIVANLNILQNIIKSLKSSLPKVAWGIGYL